MIQIHFHFGKLFAVILALVVLCLGLVFGYSKGQKQAQSDLVIRNTFAAAQALDNFYGDQNRFPTAGEFASNNTMLAYSTGFPFVVLSIPACEKVLDYKRLTVSSYQLSFCLPVAFGQYGAGWNQVSGKK